MIDPDRFLPTTIQECRRRGWERLDVILVTGDSYIDSPHVGAAVIGRVLADRGFRVGVIAQPEMDSGEDIRRLGEPVLFWGVTGGCVDSMVANTTAIKKRRKSDDFTPGGRNTRRPDRAVIAYANLIRRHFKNTRPIVLGGIEASLRRVTHYDYWDDGLRRSILVDAKADYLVYGMGERTAVALAEALRDDRPVDDLPGLCRMARSVPGGYIELPSHVETLADAKAFSRMFETFYRHADPASGKGLAQRQDTRFLVQNPPAPYLSQAELDAVYALDYQHAQHPRHEAMGPVRALETIRFSIATHRGCYGECRFCAIAVHQGRTVRWRSPESVVAEARRMTGRAGFRGRIHDVGGPTANMYGFECRQKIDRGPCPHRSCLFPTVCSKLHPDHGPSIALLSALRSVPGVEQVIVASGIRCDLVAADPRSGPAYIDALARHHVSGQLKVAPEHSEFNILKWMGKPDISSMMAFKRHFDAASRGAGRKQYLTYYFIAAHPGCTEDDMKRLATYARRELGLKPEQVQIFTPTPSTFSSLMYYTGRDPATGERLFVERSLSGKARQKAILIPNRPGADRRNGRNEDRNR